MKKAYLMMISTLLFVFVIGAGIHVYAENPLDDGYTHRVWGDDFESYSINENVTTANFSHQPANGKVIQDSDPIRGQVLMVPVKAPSGTTTLRNKYDSVTQEFPSGSYNQLYQAKLTFDMKWNVRNNAAVDTLSYTSNDIETLFDFTVAGKITYRDYRESTGFIEYGEYDANTWYSFIVYLDASSSSYTAYVNGDLIVENGKYSQAESKNGLRAFGAYIKSGGAGGTGREIYLDNFGLWVVDRWMYAEQTIFSDDFDGEYTQIEGLDQYYEDYYHVEGDAVTVAAAPDDESNAESMRLNTKAGSFSLNEEVIQSIYPDADGKRLIKTKISFDIMAQEGANLKVSVRNYDENLCPVLDFKEDGKITPLSTGSVCYNLEAKGKYETYTPLTWYNVTIYIYVNNADLGNQGTADASYVLFINDEKLCTGMLSNSQNIKGIDSISFEGSVGEGETYVYIDNLMVDVPGESIACVTKEGNISGMTTGKIIYNLNPRLNDSAVLVLSSTENGVLKDIKTKEVSSNDIASIGGVFPYTYMPGRQLSLFQWENLTTLKPQQNVMPLDIQ